jgi:DNA excision repair protein ERCC-2
MSLDKIDLFPFPATRHGQREFLQDARECASSGDVLVAHAPTGLGKTAVALSASLESSLRDGGRTVFLTPRQSQHRAVIETVKMLPRTIRTVDLLSRESMCPLGRPACLEGRRCHLQAEKRMAQCAREVLQRPLHAQELIALCLRRGSCPYLTARVALSGADLIVGDVSRTFGDLPDVIRFQGTSRPQRLVVDEAHNLPGRITDMFSKDLVLPCEGDPLESVWTRMLSQGHRIIPRSELRTLLEGLDLPELEVWEETHEFVRDWSRFGDASVRVAFPDEGRIALRFLEPSLVVNSVLKHCASAIFMSGTLHPPEVFATRMGLEGAVCRSYPSPFDPARRLALVVPDVGTRYRERCRQRTVDMASRISELSSAVPGNVMVFLPSYAYLSAVYRELRRLGQRKSLLAERPGMDKMERDCLAQRLQGRAEVLMLCNIHGSFSEGVDFPAGCLSAVMVAGLPIPPPSLERGELLLRASRGLGEDTARTYLDTYEALSKVLQACGRAIRREEDRAAVVLMDPRYKDGKVLRLLPPDMRFSEGDPVELLREFFRQEPLERWDSLAEGERIITGH